MDFGLADLEGQPRILDKDCPWTAGRAVASLDRRPGPPSKVVNGSDEGSFDPWWIEERTTLHSERVETQGARIGVTG
jgi:hypothetical protein